MSYISHGTQERSAARYMPTKRSLAFLFCAKSVDYESSYEANLAVADSQRLMPISLCVRSCSEKKTREKPNSTMMLLEFC